MNSPEIKWNQLERNLWAAPPGKHDWMLYTKCPQHLWATSDKLPRCEVLGTNLINKQMPMSKDFSTFNMCVFCFQKSSGYKGANLQTKTSTNTKTTAKYQKSKSVTSSQHQKCSSKRMNKPWPNACCTVLRQMIKLSQPFVNWPWKKRVIDWCQFRAGNTSCTNLQGFRQRGRSLLQPHGRQHP